MLSSWVASSRIRSKIELKSKERAQINLSGRLFILASTERKLLKELIQKFALDWQKVDLLKQTDERELFYFHTPQDGPFWVVCPKKKTEGTANLNLSYARSDFAWFRDTLGGLVSHFRAHRLMELFVSFENIHEEHKLACLLGFDIAAYSYKSDVFKTTFKDLPQLIFDQNSKISEKVKKGAVLQAQAVNMARHLTNMPPNELNPETFEQWIKKIPFKKNIEIEVWDSKKLFKENMNLILAVGQGAVHGPRMIRLKYRPQKNKKNTPAYSFVGKGITFDSGGLDLKPSSNMRWMKKDMGGAAAVTALAYFASLSESLIPCDFYLALAENAVDGKSFRPGDVFTARNGKTVEIDNTDAEGRLVLADTLDVACRDKDSAPIVIDIATLTGAGKVALGADIASLFSNDDELSDRLFKSGFQSGDLVWRMPLFQKYFSSMSSNFADFKNSGESFGGAITAALFLEKFVSGKKWAHLDIYAWNDKADGALSTVGGSGQSVQCLIEFFKENERLKNEKKRG